MSPLIIAPPLEEPFVTPALTANLALRLLFAFLVFPLCAVPLRLLAKNSEFAAVVFIVNLFLANLDIIVNSLLYRTDDTSTWYSGEGLCDVVNHSRNFSLALYETCLLAIMRNLAIQVGLLQAHPLSTRDKRRRNLVQALIMFPIPVLRVALTYPLQYQRYSIGTLVGCSYQTTPNWLSLTVFVFTRLLVSAVTCYYTVLTFFRFRALSKTTVAALSANRLARLRAQRTKRRLYLMMLCIVIVNLPWCIFLTVMNLKDVGTDVLPYSFDELHDRKDPLPWDTVDMIPSRFLSFLSMNNSYTWSLSAVPAFVFFGLTKDAVNEYRRIALSMGLGRFFLGLHTEYDPIKSASEDSSWLSTGIFSSTAVSEKIKSVTGPKRGSSDANSSSPSLDFITFTDLEACQVEIQKPEAVVRTTTTDTHEHDQPAPDIRRSRFTLPFSIFPRRHRCESTTQHIDSAPACTAPRTVSAVETRVWSMDAEAAGRARQEAQANHVDEIVAVEPEGVVVETALTRESRRMGSL